MYDRPSNPRDVDAGIRDAVRFTLGVAVMGAALLLTAVVWVSTCQGATADSAACGPPQRTLLALAAPGVLLAGGLTAFFRTHQTSRQRRPSRAWQGAGWFLITLMVLVLTTSMPALAGITVLGA